jgi:predicted RNase H-like nuclease (RuvC/YqgF family)
MNCAIITFMGAIVFNNEIFDSWLTKKSDQILSKVDRETISTEEMIILVLKAQTNHFDHMDQDMKLGISDLKSRMNHLEGRMDRLENRLDSVDKKIDNRFMWMIGITIAMSGGIYLKLFLG